MHQNNKQKIAQASSHHISNILRNTCCTPNFRPKRVCPLLRRKRREDKISREYAIRTNDINKVFETPRSLIIPLYDGFKNKHEFEKDINSRNFMEQEDDEYMFSNSRTDSSYLRTNGTRSSNKKKLLIPTLNECKKKANGPTKYVLRLRRKYGKYTYNGEMRDRRSCEKHQTKITVSESIDALSIQNLQTLKLDCSCSFKQDFFLDQMLRERNSVSIDKKCSHRRILAYRHMSLKKHQQSPGTIFNFGHKNDNCNFHGSFLVKNQRSDDELISQSSRRRNEVRRFSLQPKHQPR